MPLELFVGNLILRVSRILRLVFSAIIHGSPFLSGRGIKSIPTAFSGQTRVLFFYDSKVNALLCKLFFVLLEVVGGFLHAAHELPEAFRLHSKLIAPVSLREGRRFWTPLIEAQFEDVLVLGIGARSVHDPDDFPAVDHPKTERAQSILESFAVATILGHDPLEVVLLFISKYHLRPSQ